MSMVQRQSLIHKYFNLPDCFLSHAAKSLPIIIIKIKCAISEWSIRLDSKASWVAMAPITGCVLFALYFFYWPLLYVECGNAMKRHFSNNCTLHKVRELRPHVQQSQICSFGGRLSRSHWSKIILQRCVLPSCVKSDYWRYDRWQSQLCCIWCQGPLMTWALQYFRTEESKQWPHRYCQRSVSLMLGACQKCWPPLAFRRVDRHSPQWLREAECHFWFSWGQNEWKSITITTVNTSALFFVHLWRRNEVLYRHWCIPCQPATGIGGIRH